MAYESELHVNLFLLVCTQMYGMSVCFSGHGRTNHCPLMSAGGRWSLGLRVVFSPLSPLFPFQNPNPRRLVHYPLSVDDVSSFSCSGVLVSLHSCLLEVCGLLTVPVGTLSTMRLEGGDGEATHRSVRAPQRIGASDLPVPRQLYRACVSLGISLRLERR